MLMQPKVPPKVHSGLSHETHPNNSELANFPRSEIKLAKILLDRPAPHMSALSWVVLCQRSREVLFGKLEKERREVASLTKIMTLYTVL